MQLRHLSLAAGILLTSAGAVAAAHASTSDYSARHLRHHRHRTHVVIQRDVYGWQNGFGAGPGGYPAHSVPLAAYPAPSGIGIVFRPFGWQRWTDRREGGWR